MRSRPTGVMASEGHEETAPVYLVDSRYRIHTTFTRFVSRGAVYRFLANRSAIVVWLVPLSRRSYLSLAGRRRKRHGISSLSLFPLFASRSIHAFATHGHRRRRRLSVVRMTHSRIGGSLQAIDSRHGGTSCRDNPFDSLCRLNRNTIVLCAPGIRQSARLPCDDNAFPSRIRLRQRVGNEM